MTPLTIAVTKGVGTGPTELAAFDDALSVAGIGNQNLIYLSSIIPPGSRIASRRPALSDDEFGRRTFCVMAQHRTALVGHSAWAGIGWVTDPHTGRGVFAEAHGESEETVANELVATIESMCARREQIEWSEFSMSTIGAVCELVPVCAVVAAVFTTEPW